MRPTLPGRMLFCAVAQDSRGCAKMNLQRGIAHATPSASLDCEPVPELVTIAKASLRMGHTASDPEYHTDILARMVACA